MKNGRKPRGSGPVSGNKPKSIGAGLRDGSKSRAGGRLGTRTGREYGSDKGLGSETGAKSERGSKRELGAHVERGPRAGHGVKARKEFAGSKFEQEFTRKKGPKKDSDRGFGADRGSGGAKRGPSKRSESFDAPKEAFEGKKSLKRIAKEQQDREELINRDVLVNAIEEEDEREDRIEGRNPVFEALRSGRPLNKLFIEKGSEDAILLRIAAMAREKNIPVQYLERRKLDMMSKTRIHQGVILEAAAQEYVEVDDILAIAGEKGEDPFIIILDGITDTNNLGSIIRSAECAGVHGIIIPKRRSASLNATVAKVAAGALEYVPVARVTNVVQTLRDLKRDGVWIIGADMGGESVYYDANLTGPCALVIGSEGEGLSRLVKDECDLLVNIPMKGKISSLNAGVAAALILFEVARQRNRK